MTRLTAIVILTVACCLAQNEKPAPTIPDLETAAQGLYMKADYEGSRQALLQAWDLAQQLPREDPLRYDVLKRLSTVRAAMGEWADADNFLQLAISWREQVLGPDDPKIPDDVLMSVEYARGQKDYERALLIMQKVRGMHMMANARAGASMTEARESEIIADDWSRVAQIQMELKQPEAAAFSLKVALEIRTKLHGPLDPSLVFDLDRLAGIQVMKRAYDEAEETYRHALVVRETLYGKIHGDLLSTLDGLAYSLFGQKKYEEAEPVYKRLLDLWINQMGSETHPMVAIALDKMAVFYIDQKKWEEARAATARANAIRTFVLAEGLSVEASQRIDEGKLEEALPIYQKAIKLLDPPNPIYDKQRSDLEGMAREVLKAVKNPPSKAPPRVSPPPSKK
jgi:tetratricopeptide (TPR) repeat protein